MAAVNCFFIYGLLFPLQWQRERLVLHSEAENVPLRCELPASRPLMDFKKHTACLSGFMKFFDHSIYILGYGEDRIAFEGCCYGALIDVTPPFTPSRILFVTLTDVQHHCKLQEKCLPRRHCNMMKIQNRQSYHDFTLQSRKWTCLGVLEKIFSSFEPRHVLLCFHIALWAKPVSWTWLHLSYKVSTYSMWLQWP